MGKAIPYATRMRIIELRSAGNSYSAISEALRVSYNAVQQLCSQYQSIGIDALETKYDNCGHHGSTFSDAILSDITRLREASLHGWGAGRIRVELEALHLKDPIPSERSVSRHLNFKKMY